MQPLHIIYSEYQLCGNIRPKWRVHFFKGRDSTVLFLNIVLVHGEYVFSPQVLASSWISLCQNGNNRKHKKRPVEIELDLKSYQTWSRAAGWPLVVWNGSAFWLWCNGSRRCTGLLCGRLITLPGCRSDIYTRRWTIKICDGGHQALSMAQLTMEGCR